MEQPIKSLLLYSNYSDGCKSLLELINSSEVDFDTLFNMTAIRVDNKQLRNRILADNRYNITKVPCILLFHNKGRVETYDGEYAFDFVNSIISEYEKEKYELAEIERKKEQEILHQKQLEQERLEYQQRLERERLEREKKDNEPIDMQSQIMMRAHEEQLAKKTREDNKNIPKRMQKISGTSSVEELLGKDRNLNLPKPPRIRQGRQGYIEDDNLFAGERIDHRQNPSSSSIKHTTSNIEDDPKGIKSMSKRLAEEREEIEKQFNNQKDRPISARRP